MTEPPPPRVRYAVVGLGDIAQRAVLPAFAHAENAELTALVSGDEEKRTRLADRYGVRHTGGYDELEALIGRGVADAVYLTVPNERHRELTVRAAAAGAHVLCEKPMAVTEAECREMIDACDRASVRLMIAYRLHFEQANMEVAGLIARGEIGEPRFFSSTFATAVEEGDVRLAPIRRGGGTVYDLGVYCINAARYLFRDEPIEVDAASVRGTEAPYEDVDETTSAVLRFGGGRLAAFTSSFVGHPHSSYRVVGTEGEVLVEPAFNYQEGLRYRVIRAGRMHERRFPPRDQFAPELLHFSSAVLEGRDPEPDGHEGLADVRIIEAVYASAARGVAVALQPSPVSTRPDESQIEVRPAVEPPIVVTTESSRD